MSLGHLSKRVVRVGNLNGYWSIMLDQPTSQIVLNSAKLTTQLAASTNLSEAHKVQDSSAFDRERLTVPIVDNQTHVGKLEMPRAPGSEDCCMSGCAVCVWDIYEEALEEYRASKSAELGGGHLEEEDEVEMDPSIRAFRDMERAMKERNGG